jgi:hypothetical protein
MNDTIFESPSTLDALVVYPWEDCDTARPQTEASKQPFAVCPVHGCLIITQSLSLHLMDHEREIAIDAVILDDDYFYKF